MEKSLPIIVIINKIDRPDARIDEVINEVYDLFIDLDASDDQIEFPILFTDAKLGIAHLEIGDASKNLTPLFETIISKIEGPNVSNDGVSQFLVTSLDYDSYVGQIAVGRLNNGTLSLNSNYALCKKDEVSSNQKFSALYTFRGLNKVPVDKVESGDIIAFSGIENISIGDTVSDNDNPAPLPRIEVDEPTVSMLFYVNDSPFAGQDGK